jgi:hypothetical protein
VSSTNLTRQWGIYSLIFLIALGLIVSLLPAGDSLGLFSVLATLINFLLSILFFLGQLIISLLALLFGLPFMLFGGTPPALRPAPPPPLPVLPPAAPVLPQTNSAIWTLIRSILLWGSLAAIISRHHRLCLHPVCETTRRPARGPPPRAHHELAAPCVAMVI